MRIAINCLNLKLLEPAGPDVYLINLLQNLAKIDQENEYTLIFSKNTSWPMKTLNIQNSNFTPVFIKKAFSTTHTNLAWFLYKSKFDAYFTSYHTIPLFRPRTTKFISMIHGLEYQTNFANTSFFSTKGFFEWFTLVFSSAVIVASKYVQKSINDKNWKRVNNSKIHVVHEGVSQNFYKRSEEEIITVKNSFKIDGEYLFFVSTLQPRKNIPIMVQAFAHLIKTDPTLSKVKLVIAGKKGWDYEESLNAPSQFDVKKNVVFTGRITNEELAAFYSGARAYVNFSVDEGFGLPLLEAFKSQTLCVVSDIPAFREMGLALPIYADPHNYLDISNKMAMALKLSEAEKQAKIAKQLELASNFTWQITAEKTLTIIKNTVKGL
jgi:glycosyltransferase involved in cell wall biosynthesis